MQYQINSSAVLRDRAPFICVHRLQLGKRPCTNETSLEKVVHAPQIERRLGDGQIACLEFDQGLPLIRIEYDFRTS